MKAIFVYTEEDDKHKTSEAMKKYAGKKGRKLQMNNLFQRVKSRTSNNFITKKWEDLLVLFGGRRCRSMIELSTGWDKEKDPRKLKTWPVSRDEEERMEKEGILATPVHTCKQASH